MGIGIKQEEENHAQGHEIHVDQQEYATVIEAPAPLHATNRVDGAGKSDKTGQNEKGIWMDNGEAGDQKRESQAQKNQQNATEEGSLARVENARGHAILINVTTNSMPLDYLGAAGVVASAGVVAGAAAAPGTGVASGLRPFTSEVATSTAPKWFLLRSWTAMRRKYSPLTGALTS